MKLVMIDSATSVNPGQVSTIQTDSGGRGVTVVLMDGRSFWVDRDYGKSAYETKDEAIYLRSKWENEFDYNPNHGKRKATYGR